MFEYKYKVSTLQLLDCSLYGLKQAPNNKFKQDDVIFLSGFALNHCDKCI